jgi:hypothetical protein
MYFIQVFAIHVKYKNRMSHLIHDINPVILNLYFVNLRNQALIGSFQRDYTECPVGEVFHVKLFDAFFCVEMNGVICNVTVFVFLFGTRRYKTAKYK